jgi:hypothetical protein
MRLLVVFVAIAILAAGGWWFVERRARDESAMPRAQPSADPRAQPSAEAVHSGPQGAATAESPKEGFTGARPPELRNFRRTFEDRFDPQELDAAKDFLAAQPDNSPFKVIQMTTAEAALFLELKTVMDDELARLDERLQSGDLAPDEFSEKSLLLEETLNEELVELVGKERSSEFVAATHNYAKDLMKVVEEHQDAFQSKQQ